MRQVYIEHPADVNPCPARVSSPDRGVDQIRTIRICFCKLIFFYETPFPDSSDTIHL